MNEKSKHLKETNEIIQKALKAVQQRKLDDDKRQMASSIGKDLSSVLKDALREAQDNRNEEDRKYLAIALGKDIVTTLDPLLGRIAENSKFNRGEIESILKGMKPADVVVNVPKQEPQRTPIVNIPAFPKIPTPQVTVKPADVIMPKEMEVKGLAGLAKSLLAALKKPFDVVLRGVNQDNPLPVILTDEKGSFYKAVMTAISSGGGGGGSVVITDMIPLPAGDNDIGNVDIASALPAGTNNIGDVDIASALPAGTNTIGSVFPNQYELAGNTVHVKKYYTSVGAATDGIIWSPAVGKRWYITDICINVSGDATVTLEDDLAGGDEVVWKAELAANSGWSHSFTTPLYSGEDAADLIITTSANDVYVMVTGYEV